MNWHPFPRDPDYVVSPCGKIRSLKSDRVLAQFKNNRGYPTVGITTKGKQKTYFVHRIVAETFLYRDENRTDVNHINGIKEDNSISNLEWVTKSQNVRHAIETKLIDRSKTRYKRKIPRVLRLNALALLLSGSSIKDVMKKTGLLKDYLGKLSRGNFWGDITKEEALSSKVVGL